MSRRLLRATLLLLGLPQALTYLGALLNQIAVNANQGLMPVYMSACTVGDSGTVMHGVRVLDEMHSCMSPSTNLAILCDWINLHAAVLSPGDVLLSLGDLTVGPAFWAWMAYVLYRAAQPRSLC